LDGKRKPSKSAACESVGRPVRIRKRTVRERLKSRGQNPIDL